MGKGTIISHIGDGQYSVTVNFYKAQYDKRITVLDKNIASLTEKLSDVTISLEKYKILALQKAALQKEKKRLQENFPEDETIEAWCADLTEDLSGEVGTIEIPGEDTNIQIAPGYTDKAEYVAADSGQLVPTITQNLFELLYNFALLPGWQKWKPTYRYGIITSKTGDNCNITLEDYKSTQQNLKINQTDSLVNVPIEYMSCNGAAFETGDIVLIKFDDQDWTKPKVVGFKEEPKPCFVEAFIIIEFHEPIGTRKVLVWDLANNIAPTLTNDAGTILTYPCDYSDMNEGIHNYAEEKGRNVVNEALTRDNWEKRALHWVKTGYGGEAYNGIEFPNATADGTVFVEFNVDVDSISCTPSSFCIEDYEEHSYNTQLYSGHVDHGPDTGRTLSVLQDYTYVRHSETQYGSAYEPVIGITTTVNTVKTLLGNIEYEFSSDINATPMYSGQELTNVAVKSIHSEHSLLQLYHFLLIPYNGIPGSVLPIVYAASTHFPLGDGMIVGNPLIQDRNSDLEEALVFCIEAVQALVGYPFDVQFDMATITFE